MSTIKLTKTNHEVIKHPALVGGYTVKVYINKGANQSSEKLHFIGYTKAAALKSARDFLKTYSA